MIAKELGLFDNQKLLINWANTPITGVQEMPFKEHRVWLCCDLDERALAEQNISRK